MARYADSGENLKAILILAGIDLGDPNPASD